jgi:hypothetical protein
MDKIPLCLELMVAIQLRITEKSFVPFAHACNPSYLGDWSQEDHGSRPPLATASRDPVSKITRAKRTGGLAQALERLLWSTKPWVQTLVPPRKKNNWKKVRLNTAYPQN